MQHWHGLTDGAIKENADGDIPLIISVATPLFSLHKRNQPILGRRLVPIANGSPWNTGGQYCHCDLNLDPGCRVSVHVSRKQLVQPLHACIHVVAILGDMLRYACNIGVRGNHFTSMSIVWLLEQAEATSESGAYGLDKSAICLAKIFWGL